MRLYEKNPTPQALLFLWDNCVFFVGHTRFAKL
jgi:hypothetical protein